MLVRQEVRAVVEERNEALVEHPRYGHPDPEEAIVVTMAVGEVLFSKWLD
jgi:hypothetical protein